VAVIVNDIKREFWDATAGWRQKGLNGRSLIFDPRGTGHKFDPLEGRTTDSDLRSAATILLHRPREGENAVFTDRAVTMLTQIFHAAKLENQRALPFTYKILNEGLYATATILKIISDKHDFYPRLVTKFLDISYEQADFNSKFLQDCYSTMTASTIFSPKETVRCFTGSEFTGRDIITSGDHPISLYLCWPERDLLTLGPLIELVWDCLINDMVDSYDALKGQGCSPTLLVPRRDLPLGYAHASGVFNYSLRPEYFDSAFGPVQIAAGSPLRRTQRTSAQGADGYDHDPPSGA
jgi:type IV secretory pathway TraG/TraD family ATPase VirD4